MKLTSKLRCALMMMFIALACVSSARAQTTYPTELDVPPKLADNAITYLTSPMTSSAMVCNVSTTTGFYPVSVVQIGNEWLLVEKVVTQFIVIARGYGGTVAAAHPAKAPVRAIFTSFNINPASEAIAVLELRVGTGATTPNTEPAGSYLRTSGDPLHETTVWERIRMEDLGTGTPSSSNYLRGDGSWQAITPGITGTGTSGKLVKWLTSTTQGDSLISESGTGLSATATLSLIAPSTSSIPLTLRGVASQTASLQEWQDSGGNVAASFAPNGANWRMTYGKSGAGAISASFDMAVTKYVDGQSFQIHTNDGAFGGAGTTGSFRFHPAASNGLGQMFAQNDAGYEIYSFNQAGSVVYGHLLFNGNGVTVNNSSTSITQFTVQGTASQTADLTHWKDSAGSVLASITSGGDANFPSLSTTSDINAGADVFVSGSLYSSNSVNATIQVEAPAICLSGNICWTKGTAAPSGVCNDGSLYTRTTTGKLYVCENTAWVMK